MLLESIAISPLGAQGWTSYSEGRQRKKYFQLHFLTSGLAALVRYNLIGLILKLKTNTKQQFLLFGIVTAFSVSSLAVVSFV